MRRALLIVLLSFGTVAGYASGIHHLRHGGCGSGHGYDQRSQGWSCPCHEAPPPAPPSPAAPQQPKAPETPPSQ
ncbi:MAG TPA: hypothetical protein VGK67_20280 [Myxococcales bacterium]|jgi:hypothetical protein